MRARSLKPGVCDNELLGTADPFCTLLFERLWMMADREGRLEDRPLRIKAQAFPYREGLDMEALLSWLTEQGFIRRYTVTGQRFIQVIKFLEHQKPHQNEKHSVIPPPPAASTCHLGAPTSTTKVASEHNQGTKHLALTPSSLTPDSGLLTADSSSLRSQDPSASATPERKAASRGTSREDPAWLLDFKLTYPTRAGDQGWRKAVRAAHARIQEGHSTAEFIAGAKRYAAFCDASAKTGTEYVKQACTFLGPDKAFLLPWHAPPKTETASQRILRTLNGTDERRVIEHDPERNAIASTR